MLKPKSLPKKLGMTHWCTLCSLDATSKNVKFWFSQKSQFGGNENGSENFSFFEASSKWSCNFDHLLAYFEVYRMLWRQNFKKMW